MQNCFWFPIHGLNKFQENPLPLHARSLLYEYLQSRIKFLEARFKNKLVGPSKYNLPWKISEWTF